MVHINDPTVLLFVLMLSWCYWEFPGVYFDGTGQWKYPPVWEQCWHDTDNRLIGLVEGKHLQTFFGSAFSFTDSCRHTEQTEYYITCLSQKFGDTRFKRCFNPNEDVFCSVVLV